ncbi:similar to Saccharomyces cerevisiae YMR157C AIM36 Protein of unknown function [Maudiozyma saulgeensis]|uniref:Altered inheritance of mitochondria protein 36, mitochondrial n=1 Tax=Maudiozyma saulgeensis TaxID=1789683 RepID=A0A1X7R1T8_9SACH|nr:similar to Saccharomyces cerevisiae YMR157C AIM36 Protein of unknown function [Kazachstania saulgeensis]
MLRILGKGTVNRLCKKAVPTRNVNTIIPSVVALPLRKQTPVCQFSIPSKRYSSSKSNKAPADELPSFKKLIMIGLVGTAVFVLAVRSLDQNKPKTSYSEEEYQQVVNGLKRKIAIFQPGEIDMQLTTLPDIKSAKNKLPKADGDIPPIHFIDPKNIVDIHKNDSNDKYRVLLENIHKIYGNDYYYNLPEGLLVALMLQYIRDNVKPNEKVVIVDFPKSIKDASNFESEIAVVSKVIIPKDQSETDICKYFETVDKVTLV